jgi:AAA+ superfamily predicted ATPase
MRFTNNSRDETSLLGQYLRPASRVVEHLAGLPGLDSELADCAELLNPEQVHCSPWLPDAFIARLDIALEGQLSNGEIPMFAFKGGYGTGKKLAARYLASQLNKPLLMLDLASLEESQVGVREGLRLALRDGQLLDAMLFISQWDMILEDGRPQPTLYQLLLAYPGIVIIAGEATWQPVGKMRRRRILRVTFARADYERRLQTWEHQIGETDLPLAHLANHFRFTPGQIADVAATARDLAEWRSEPIKREDLFSASRDHSNQKLADLATKISPRYQWQDIVLPVDTVAQLREMVNTVRQRPIVYGQWGFGQKLSLGKGLSALFAGESGTGKTMAADIIAGELELDLYKIDLSMLVSKYIGETEKNLRKVFSEAETSNAILFFDEADAIFGKRSEVKDSHDRYANIEISYLLQRMESYDGVVILATNMRANLDEAFTRRLHFIVEFPFPEASDREVIWKVNFPKQTPIAENVDYRLLAERYRIAGGNIRNIIMAAAFLAADDGQIVGMDHLFHAARREYQKIGRLIDEALFISSSE